MRRFLDRLYAGSGALAAVSVFLICALMLAQAFARGMGGQIRGTDDIVSWLCAAAAFFALGHTFRHGELVRVGLLVARLPPRARRVAEPSPQLKSALSKIGAQMAAEWQKTAGADGQAILKAYHRK